MPETPPKPPKFPIETTWGEIEAFRVWRVFDHQSRLFSSYTDHEWKPGEVMQAHKRIADNDDRDISIRSGERTGIHAWKSMVEVVEYGQAILESKETRLRIHRALAFGRVKLWGEVVEHERGYRAEFAKIVGIDDLVEMETTKDYDINRDKFVQSRRSKWLGEDLAAMRARYFPERVRKQPNA